MNKIKVSEHFHLYEFECHDGSHLVKLDEKLLTLLELMRAEASRIKGKDCKMFVDSGYRTKAYNDKVGGSPQSQHLEGKAGDVRIQGFTYKQVADIAEKCGADGIGLHNKDGTPYNFCHVDVRGKKARW